MLQHAGGHYWTTGAAILFMGGLGLIMAVLAGVFIPEGLGFIGFDAFLSISVLYLGVGGYLVARNWNAANDD
ncbi:MAG: hypothetical protein AAGA48_02335 [Myxococcota bacterium]